MPTPPPGWYADPAGSEQYRWWDGSTWTDALSVSRHARPPSQARAAGPDDPRVSSTPADVPPDDLEPAGTTRAATDATGAADAADATDPAHPEHTPAPGRTTGPVETIEVGSRHRSARPMTAVVVFALLAVTALGAGAVLFRPDRQRTSSTVSSSAPATPVAPQLGGTSGTSGTNGSTPAPGAGSPSVPTGWVDQRTGEAQMGDATMTLPADPYVIDPNAGRLSPVVDAMFSANAPVHLHYSATGSWYSTVALLHVSAAAVNDPQTATQQSMTSLLTWLFGADVRVANFRSDSVPVSGRPATQVEFEAWYDIDGLASTHDDVSVVLVVLPDGSYAAALSSVPDDAPAAQREMAKTALATLTVR